MTRTAAAFAAPLRVAMDAASEWRAAATRGAPLSMSSNSILLIGSKLAAMGTGFLGWLVAARLFAPADVGLASAAVSATTLCAQLALLGLGTSVIGLMPAQQSKRPLLDVAFTLVGCAALGAAAAFLVVAALLLGDLRVVATDPLFAATFATFCLAGTLGVLLDQVSTVERRGDQALVRNVAAGIVTLALVPAATLVVAGRSLAIFGAWTLGALAMLGLGVEQFRRGELRYAFRPALARSLAVGLLRLGIPNHLLTLAERLPGAVLPILVTELLSPAENAYWYGVWMMAWVIFIIPIQIGITLYAEISHEPARVRQFVGEAFRLSLALDVLAVLAALAAAGPALSLLGPAYAAAGEVPLRIVVLAVLPMTVIEIYYGVCRGMRRLGEAIVLGLASAAVALAAAVAVAPQFGLAGIATAWLAVEGVAAFVAGGRLLRLLRTP